MAIAKPLARTEEPTRRPAIKNRNQRLRTRSWDHRRTLVPWRNASSASLILTRLFLTGRAPTKTRLWRQAAQTIWTLDAMRRPPTAVARPRFRKPVARYAWDWDRRIGHCD